MKSICQIAVLGGSLLPLLLLTGCVTAAVWQSTDYYPADPPNLALAIGHEQGDLLVRYEELQKDSKKPHTRAFWLFAYQDKYDKKPAKTPKPSFVSPALYDRLTPVEFVDASATNLLAQATFCAYLGSDQNTFHLVRNGQNVGSYRLPCYHAGVLPKGWRLGLTPLALGADAAIVCAAALSAAPAPSR